VKQATGAVVNIFTGGSLKNTIEERIAPALRFRPEMCSLNMGFMNFSFHPLAKRYDTWKFDWEKDYVANSDNYIFRNTFRDIETVAGALAPHSVKFEHECYDIGHLYNLRFCMDIGLFKAPIFIQFILDILGGIGPEVDNLIFMKRTADRMFESDYRWSVLGARGRPDASGHHRQPDGRQRPRRSRVQPVHWPRQARPLQCRAGKEDTPDHRRPGFRDCDARQSARDPRARGCKSRRLLTQSAPKRHFTA
jgi:hypothetical protein